MDSMDSRRATRSARLSLACSLMNPSSAMLKHYPAAQKRLARFAGEVMPRKEYRNSRFRIAPSDIARVHCCSESSVEGKMKTLRHGILAGVAVIALASASG